jgi:ABC-2 type transport system ATP-binding protein
MIGQRSVDPAGPAVDVQGLCKAYGAVRAVDDVSFRVTTGEIFALLGPNGAGKTTAIEILEGFRPRDAGAVSVLGVDPADRHTQRWLRRRIGVVLQELAVEPYFSVRQTLTRNAGFYPSPRPVDEVIELVGLGEKRDARVDTLSGGQQRRLDLGLGIVGNPELLFLDEPTSGLDPAARRATWELVRGLAAAGTTVILTSHYMDEVEALADQVAVIAAGHVIASGSPARLGNRETSAATIRFRLPDGVDPTELPIPPSENRSGEIEIRTTDEQRVLDTLLTWAAGRGLALAGLTVSRASLEDIYLALTRDEPDRPDEVAQ